MDLGPYFGDHGPVTDEERAERYLLDRTCLACGDTSGFLHPCNNVDFGTVGRGA